MNLKYHILTENTLIDRLHRAKLTEKAASKVVLKEVHEMCGEYALN